MTHRVLVKFILSALLLLCCSACGYHREGQQSPSRARQSLYIELFANDTHRAFVNDTVTVQVIERFARSPYFTVVEDPAQADLLFGGTIALYDTTPIAYNQDDTISAYRADLTVRATLRRPGAKREVVWTSTVTTSQDYIFNNPDLVLQQSAERLANELYTDVTDTLFWGGMKIEP